jgi:hypothetical protein
MHKIVQKKAQTLSSSMIVGSYEDICLQAKSLLRISKSKRGHNYANKQIRVMGLVQIM